MRGKLSKRVISVVISLLTVAGGLPIQELKGATVLADEMQGEEMVISGIENDAVRPLPIKGGILESGIVLGNESDGEEMGEGDEPDLFDVFTEATENGEAGTLVQLPFDTNVDEDISEKDQTAEGEASLGMNDTTEESTITELGQATENKEQTNELIHGDEGICGEEIVAEVSDEELVAANSSWIVGDGVTAKIVVEGGKNVLYFKSKGGTLWHDWRSKIGEAVESVNVIKATEDSTKLYLPEDSSYLFSGVYLESLEQVETGKFDTSRTTTMRDMFQSCNRLRIESKINVPISIYPYML